MKSIVCFLLLLTAPSVQSEIFKCTAASGKTFYQDKECPGTTKTEEVEVKPFDQEKYEAARKRLAEDLRQQAEYEDIEAHRALKEREVRAMERNAQANEDMVDATLLEQEEAYQRNNIYYDGYYLSPRYYTRPRHRHKDKHRAHPPKEPRPHARKKDKHRTHPPKEPRPHARKSATIKFHK